MLRHYIDANARFILDFWFSEDVLPYLNDNAPEKIKSLVKSKLLHLHQKSSIGSYDNWSDVAEEMLALIIVLFHVPRILEEDDLYSEEAIELSKHAIKFKYDYILTNKNYRFFLYYPLLYSKEPNDRKIALQKYATINRESLDFANYKISTL